MSKRTRITENGRVTIPPELRQKYGIEPGDELVWLDAEDGILVKLATSTSGRGMLVPDETPREKREEIADELEDRLRNRRNRFHEDA